jgi:hypothetical protein
MKKILFIFIALLFVGPLCFAQPAPMAPRPVAPMAAANKMITGKIQSVLSGDAAKSLKPEIIIVDSLNKQQKIVVTPATVIADKNGSVVSLDKVASGENVSVTMVVKDGIEEASTIKIFG